MRVYLAEGKNERRDALKFLAAGAAAVVAAGISMPMVGSAAAASQVGAIGDYDFLIDNAGGTIEAYDADGNQITSGSDWGALVNKLLSMAPANGVWIHTKEGLYLQTTPVVVPSGYNSPVTLSGEGMARTPQVKFTSSRPSTIIKNTVQAGKIIDTTNSNQPALFIRDITLFNAGGGASSALSLQNTLEGEITRVMVTQVDPTAPYVSEPSVPYTGSIGINLATGAGKNLFRLQQVYIINYDTGLLIDSDWVCADQLELDWCNTRCVDIEGGFYQEFRFLHAFACGGTLVYNNKPADSLGFESELTTIIGLADEGNGPTGYVTKTATVNNVKGAFMLILGTFNPAGVGRGFLTGVLTYTYGLFTEIPSVGGGSLLPGPVGINAAMKMLGGTTAGSIIYSMPFTGISYKKFLAYLNGYQNSTGTPQSIPFPTKFNQIPVLVTDATKNSSATSTSMVLPVSMKSPVTGWIVVEGF